MKIPTSRVLMTFGLVFVLGAWAAPDDEKRLKLKSTEYFLKSGAEMMDLFKDVPEAFHNTLEIGNRCNLELPFGEFHLPRFDPPEGYTEDSYFEHLCRKGLEQRYGSPPPTR